MAMIKVSVCVPTFNHEEYIEHMLKGALMQETDFTFEIVIGDDASTDNSQQIIQKYAEQYPEIIKAYLHKENQGPDNPREFAGRNNVLQLLKACKGEYVAMCEGDDYWTDPHKLQKQVDFLDSHPDFAICHHNMLVTYEDGSPSHTFNKNSQPLVSTIDDILQDRWFMATASWMYRNYFLTEDFAPWHALAAAGDWALSIQLAAKGKIGYLPETMGVYRKHSAGLSNVHSNVNVWFLKNRKEMFENVNLWLDKKYDVTIIKTVANYGEQLRKLEKIGSSI
ncbi:glycosyltransferase family 2 protein [Dyadobacter frigoris]|uniref:glycosyltransferase family 2 protein n=1 Tax=Dyadobacter frigoris TaxID=2576211 RepID=UPI001E28CE59|nr:glycosyltransferase [Dyadobacter frigoris]GLU51116.1 glycosyl transferase [Dyadobacter frigoris]